MAPCWGPRSTASGRRAVIAIGCDMARQCHLNTCPTGIATQREDLRAKFTGVPEQVIHFFAHVAQDVREGLAARGAYPGRGHRALRPAAPEVGPRPAPDGPAGSLRRAGPGRPRGPAPPALPPAAERPRRLRAGGRRDHPLALPALERGEQFSLSLPIRNSQRTAGARLSGAIALRYGDAGLPEGTVRLRFTGSAGQSFGAFLAPGVQLSLQGEANDYVGKGDARGQIAVFPTQVAYSAYRNTIVGNTVLYGATGGSLFVAGRAGERFAVRNSGAQAVVEGAGDHCCEYMTGGWWWSQTGRNFGAGMSHGLAFVLDEHGSFPQRVNRELVSLERLESAEHEAALRQLIERHHQATRSGRAGHILHQWSGYRSLFWVVVPHPPQVDTGAGAPGRADGSAPDHPKDHKRPPKGIFFAALVPRVPFGGMESTLTHLDAGQARMVDVGAKPPTEREAVARERC